MVSVWLKCSCISDTSHRRRGMVAAIGAILLLVLASIDENNSHCQSTIFTNAFLSPLPAAKLPHYHRKAPNQEAHHQQQLQQRQSINSLLLVRSNNRYPQKRDTDQRLYLFRDVFRRNNNKNNDDDDDDDQQSKSKSEESDGTDNSLSLTEEGGVGKVEKDKEPTSRKSLLPFFASKTSSSTPEVEKEEKSVFSKKEKAIDAAKSLKAQADRVRLEAEKLDVILTLDKITKLEKKLKSKSVAEDNDRRQAINLEIETLKKKLRGETPTTNTATNDGKSEQKETKDAMTIEEVITEEVSKMKDSESSSETKVVLSFSSEEIQERIKNFKNTPKFMQKIVARAAGTDMSDENFNITSLILQLEQDEKDYMSRFDISTGMMNDKPNFTEEEIEERAKQLKNVPQFVKNLYGNDSQNDTAIALGMLTSDWEDEQEKKNKQSNNNDGDSSTSDKGALGNILERFNNEQGLSDADRMVETLFPKSTRKDENFEISDAQIKSIMGDLSKDKVWQSLAAPIKVSGGFILRGMTKYENGDELIEAIDKKLARSLMKGKVSVFYVADPTPPTEEEIETGSERSPVLFVTAPDVAREPEVLQRTVITALAIGTTWYTALYPFLMNDKFMKLAEEQTALADASMPSDLSLLTDSSYPLFLAFLATQIAHELGHRVVAEIYKLETTIPTFVPSLVTGVTNAITSFKAPPKNRQQLLDFAIAGPLAGIAVSLAVLYYGLAATATMDAASYSNLPALPLEFMRQSTLGGAIIEGVLGAGTLDIPAGAIGTAAVENLFVPLHPFAIAGYIGLLVNTISLWPVGRTDGGRIAMTLFGRSGTQLAGLLALIVLIVAGFSNSDFFLFYFSYLAFFQSELEIPQRNEVDEVDFSRVLLATATGVLVVLTLVPM